MGPRVEGFPGAGRFGEGKQHSLLHDTESVPRLPVERRPRRKTASHKTCPGGNEEYAPPSLPSNKGRGRGAVRQGARPTHWEENGTVLLLLAADSPEPQDGSDREPDNSFFNMEQVMLAEGYDTHKVDNLPALKEYLDSHNTLPDVVLLSTRLGGVSTLKTGGKLCSAFPRIKIIALNNSEHTTPADCLRVGVHDAATYSNHEEVLARIEVQLAHAKRDRDFEHRLAWRPSGTPMGTPLTAADMVLGRGNAPVEPGPYDTANLGKHHRVRHNKSNLPAVMEEANLPSSCEPGARRRLPGKAVSRRSLAHKGRGVRAVSSMHARMNSGMSYPSTSPSIACDASSELGSRNSCPEHARMSSGMSYPSTSPSIACASSELGSRNSYPEQNKPANIDLLSSAILWQAKEEPAGAVVDNLQRVHSWRLRSIGAGRASTQGSDCPLQSVSDGGVLTRGATTSSEAESTMKGGRPLPPGALLRSVTLLSDTESVMQERRASAAHDRGRALLACGAMVASDVESAKPDAWAPSALSALVELLPTPSENMALLTRVMDKLIDGLKDLSPDAKLEEFHVETEGLKAALDAMRQQNQAIRHNTQRVMELLELRPDSGGKSAVQ